MSVTYRVENYVVYCPLNCKQNRGTRHRRNIWRQIAYSPICCMQHMGDRATGLVRERQVSLTCGRRGGAAGLRRPDVLRQDYNRGREEHAIQRPR